MVSLCLAPGGMGAHSAHPSRGLRSGGTLRADRLLPKDNVAAVILVTAAVYLIMVLWFPILQTFAWSLTDKFMFKMTWVGFDNYRQMILDDPIFIQSIRVTLSYMLMVLPASAIFGLFLALLVNSVKNVTLRGLFSASYFLAYVVPLVAVAIVWRYMFEPSRVGLFNAILGRLGIGTVRWLMDPTTALPSLAIMGTWHFLGYVLIIYLAGLQTIPDVFYEAAHIDGANRWNVFRHITLPLLTPTILFVVVIGTLHTMMMFTESYVMTSQMGTLPGGPLGSTTTAVLYIWQTAFAYQKEGYASAISVVLFLLINVVTFVQFRVIRRSFEY